MFRIASPTYSQTWSLTLQRSSSTRQGRPSRPKGVCLSHYNLCVNAEALQERHRLTSDTTTMCVLPMCFMNAFGFSLITTLYVGSRLVLCDQFPGPGVWEIIAKERVGVISLVPSLLRLLLLRPRRHRVPICRT